MSHTRILGRILLLLCLALPALGQEPPAAPPSSALSFQLPVTNVQGVLMVAVRPLLEGLGCRVQWDNNSREVVAARGGTVLQLAPGRKELVVDSRTVELPLAPGYYEGRLLAPAAPLVQALGASFTHDQEGATLTVVGPRSAPAEEVRGLRITVNGAPVPLPAPPHWESGRVVAPLRAVLQALGAEVGWDAAKREVVVKRAGKVVRLQAGRAWAEVNGTPVALPLAPAMSGSLLVGPVGALATALGAEVTWVGAEQTVALTTPLEAPGPGAPTQAQAVALAMDYLKGMGQYPTQVTQTEASLDQVPANGYWEAVAHGTPLPPEPVLRPAWIVKFTYTGLSPEDFKVVYVDAETGKVIGGTQSR